MAASSSHSVLTATAEEMKPIYMVNMPCFVNTEDTAIDMLGGQEHVAYTIKNETSTIQLRFPNHNPFAYNLIGSIGSKSGVLLRIKRKKSSISNSSTSSDRPIAEIVGKVTKGYDFKIPSDYAVSVFHVKLIQQS